MNEIDSIKEIYKNIKVNHDNYDNLLEMYENEISCFSNWEDDLKLDEYVFFNELNIKRFSSVKVFIDFLSLNKVLPKDIQLPLKSKNSLYNSLKNTVQSMDCNLLTSLQKTTIGKLLIYSLLTNNEKIFNSNIITGEQFHIEESKLFYKKAKDIETQNFLSIKTFRFFLERVILNEGELKMIGYFRAPHFYSKTFIKNKIKIVLYNKDTAKEYNFEIQNFYRHDIKNFYNEKNGHVGITANISLGRLPEGSYDFYFRIYDKDDEQSYFDQKVSAATLFNRFKGYFVDENKLFLITVSKRNYINIKAKGHYSKIRKIFTRFATHLNSIFNIKKGRLKKGGFDRLLYLFSFPFLKNKEIWLISERGDTCQDNSYHLFKHIRKKYPERELYYIIDKKSEDYKKIKRFGNIIDKDSIKHRIYLLFSKIVINSYDVEAYTKPSVYTKRQYLKIFGDILNYKTVFLQHGIIYNDVSASMSKNRIGNDLVISSLPREKDFIEKNMNYLSSEVVLTGLPRYDNLKYRNTVKRKVLLMPTWRRHLSLKSYLSQNSTDKDKMENLFIQSDYFNFYNSLLNSEKLKILIDKYNLDFEFYPHYEIQPYLNRFEFNNSQIKLLNKKDIDVQTLLISADLLITDYSSVFFDFLAMKKPVIFCHFDYDEFYEKQYKEGYLNLRDTKLGYITENVEDTIENIEKVVNMNFAMDQDHLEKVNDIFHFELDNLFSERVYQQITQL